MLTALETAKDLDLPELEFALGLPGFPDAHRFVLVRWGDEGPFSVLKSLEDPNLEFVVVPPIVFHPDYEPELDDTTAERLELTTADDAIVLGVVTVGDSLSASTINLLGPIVINRHTNRAMQAVLANSGYDARTPLVKTE